MDKEIEKDIDEFIVSRINYHGSNESECLEEAYLNFRNEVQKLRDTRHQNKKSFSENVKTHTVFLTEKPSISIIRRVFRRNMFFKKLAQIKINVCL